MKCNHCLSTQCTYFLNLGRNFTTQQQDFPNKPPIPPGFYNAPDKGPEKQDDHKVPPNVFMLEPNPVQPGGQPQAQGFIPPPIVQPRGNENVQDLVGREIQKKNKQERDAQNEPSKNKEGQVLTPPKDNVQQGKGDPKKNPQMALRHNIRPYPKTEMWLHKLMYLPQVCEELWNYGKDPWRD